MPNLTREELENKLSVSAQELLASNIVPPNWIVENLVQEKGLTVVAAQFGSFKSFLCMHLACCCASGKQFLNLKTKKCTVLYIDEENGFDELKRRFEKLRVGMGISAEDFANIHLVVLKGVCITSKTWQEKIRKLVEELKPNIVFLDSLVRVMDGDENNAKDMKKVFEALKPFLRQYPVSFVVLHHVRKVNRPLTINDVRGSGDISAAASSVSLLEKDDSSKFSLRQVKNRGAQRMLPAIEFLADDVQINGFWGIQITYLGEKIPTATAPEKAEIDIERWIEERMVLEFHTKDVNEMFKGIHNSNAIQSALNRMANRKRLTKAFKGKWLVGEKPNLTNQKW